MGIKTSPEISVIIPTLNGGELFRELLESLFRQSVQIDELLVVDSGSVDETVVIASGFGARVITIRPEEFDHGATRSMAAAEAQGRLLLFFTQDAIPVDCDLIKKLITPLTDDESIAFSYGRQLPAANASLSAAALRLFNYPEKSEVRGFADRKIKGLKTAFISNSCAAYRKSCLAEVGFFPGRLIFGEDTCTAGRLLQDGYKIAYVAEAEVYHSHNYTFRQEFRRSFDIGVLHAMESWLPETFGRAEGEGVRYIRFEMAMAVRQKKFHLLPLFFCRNLVKFIGYKMGKKYDALPHHLPAKLSMNRNWWNKNKSVYK